MKRVFIVSLMLVVCLAAAAQKKKELTTLVNVNYTLPKVAYEVEVILECERFVPGPYQNYAEKELGIRPEATQVSEKWAIKKINVLPQYIPDEKAVYSVSANGDYWPVTLSLSAEGFLAGIAAGKGEVFNEKKEMKYIAEALGDEERIDIMQLNTYNQLKEVLDTNYTYQEVDGEMKRIWDPIVHYAVKTDADNVKEAVSEIFRIRSERVKLLGAENNVPDGKSLEIILKEFDRMEKNYLSLFLGKRETVKVKRVFQCIPEKANEPVVAFRFSEQNGVTDTKNVAAQAYFLKIEEAVVPASSPVSGGGEAAAVYYRVPATATLKLLKGKEEKATNILERIYTSSKEALFQLTETKSVLSSESKSEWKLLLQPGIRKAVIIGVCIAVLGQFMGVNAVLYYGPSIFENAGLSGGDSLFYQVLVGLVNTLTTVLALVIIDKVGRKKLVYYGVSGMVISLVLIATYFIYGESWGISSIFLLIFFLFYVFCCAVSICAVVFVLLSEMYPTRVRGLAMSIAGFALWIGTYLIGQLTPWMLQNLTPAGTFILFAIMCVPYMLIVWKLVPETTGKSLEEIERYWMKNKN